MEIKSQHIFEKSEYDSGSVVVEAAIVFPIVVLVVFLAMYICFILYLQAYTKIVVNEALKMAASSWNNITEFKVTFYEDLIKEDIDSSSLYWRIYDTNEEYKLNTIRNHISKKIGLKGATPINCEDNRFIEVVINNRVTCKELEANINQELKSPFTSLIKLFGIERAFIIKVNSIIVIKDPTELIRNTDFVLGIANDIDSEDKLQDIMDKIHRTILNFF